MYSTFRAHLRGESHALSPLRAAAGGAPSWSESCCPSGVQGLPPGAVGGAAQHCQVEGIGKDQGQYLFGGCAPALGGLEQMVYFQIALVLGSDLFNSF